MNNALSSELLRPIEGSSLNPRILLDCPSTVSEHIPRLEQKWPTTVHAENYDIIDILIKWDGMKNWQYE